MSNTAAVEVPIEFTLAAVEPVGPFRWVLLHALQTFRPGSRPDFAVLAERLCLGERAFLDGAWAALTTAAAVDRDDFAHAGITVSGEEILSTGHVIAGPSELRKVACFFAADDGRIVATASTEIVDLRALRHEVPWRQELTAKKVAEALALQSPENAPRPDERILRFVPDWSAAREVRLKPRPPR